MQKEVEFIKKKKNKAAQAVQLKNKINSYIWPFRLQSPKLEFIPESSLYLNDICPAKYTNDIRLGMVVWKIVLSLIQVGRACPDNSYRYFSQKFALYYFSYKIYWSSFTTI